MFLVLSRAQRIRITHQTSGGVEVRIVGSGHTAASSSFFGASAFAPTSIHGGLTVSWYSGGGAPRSCSAFRCLRVPCRACSRSAVVCSRLADSACNSERHRRPARESGDVSFFQTYLPFTRRQQRWYGAGPLSHECLQLGPGWSRSTSGELGIELARLVVELRFSRLRRFGPGAANCVTQA